MNIATMFLQNLRAALVWATAKVVTTRGPRLVPVPVTRFDSRVIALGLALALTATATRAQAWGWHPGPASHTQGQIVDVQMLVNGAGAPLYSRPGVGDKRYFEAFAGGQYEVRLRNLTGNRIGVLVSVDGLNVVSGNRSNLDRNEAMYVLDPWESTTIRGWRTSLDDVRRFVFVDEERSYASRTGQANGDMGWIRVVAFTENVGWGRVKAGYRDSGPAAPMPYTPEEPRAQSDAPQTDGLARRQATESHADESAPGTGWGDQSRDPVRRTQFTAAAVATDEIILRYEYASGLRALGIEPVRNRSRVWEREDGQLGFAKPPRW
ncbi:MAG TPA: hypothetical protein VL332_03000 [Candidatus Saccharimonadaceae bacterium]|jgi:hypothetical protein|nr:hypothetical protein [Candidatus Saccharimonadaceae bacterium]